MARLNTRCNLLSIGKDKLVGKAPFKDSDISTLIFATSKAPTLVFTPVFALGLLGRYTDKDLQRATKLILELFVQD